MTEPFVSDFLDSIRRTGLLGAETVQTLTDEFRLQPPGWREAPSNDNFLKPTTVSGVARGGAGKMQPDFPLYAGAVPPESASRWDWEKMWRERRESGKSK